MTGKREIEEEEIKKQKKMRQVGRSGDFALNNSLFISANLLG